MFKLLPKYLNEMLYFLTELIYIIYVQFIYEILAQIKGHNSGSYLLKMMCNNPKLDLVNLNAYIKFDEILSIFSQDIE